MNTDNIDDDDSLEMEEHEIVKATFFNDNVSNTLSLFFLTKTKLFKIPVTGRSMEMLKQTNPWIIEVTNGCETPQQIEQTLIGQKLFMPQEAGMWFH